MDALAWEAEYFNFEAARKDRLDAVEATVLEPLGGEVLEEYEDFEVTLPDDLASYDTLEVDVVMECPDPDAAEPGSCGAWDYLANLWVLDGEDRHEVARFITTYHRKSRWVVDASHALPLFTGGETATLRYAWAPSWNTQPTGVTLRLRLSDQGKAARPTERVLLWTCRRGWRSCQ